MNRYTADALYGLDREVQIAQDRRLLAELIVGRAGIPDASPAPLYPGVPPGAVFAGPPAGISPLFPDETPGRYLSTAGEQRS